MAERAGLMELAERVERLTGPDRLVDDAIKVFVAASMFAGGASKEDAIRILGGNLDAPALPYTSSLDASMSLVPVGEAAQVTRYADERSHCVVGFGNSVIAATPALALTAACLRARDSANERGE